jgi:hypothetical protein
MASGKISDKSRGGWSFHQGCRATVLRLAGLHCFPCLHSFLSGVTSCKFRGSFVVTTSDDESYICTRVKMMEIDHSSRTVLSVDEETDCDNPTLRNQAASLHNKAAAGGLCACETQIQHTKVLS